MSDREGELQAWATDIVVADCPGCGLRVPAHVVTGLRGNVRTRKWLMFWRHYADCDRPCVTGEIMGSDISGVHKGPTTCECGAGLIDYDRPAGVALGSGSGDVV